MSLKEAINGSGAGREDREVADAHVVELVEASNAGSSSDSITQEQTTPLLVPSEKPKIDIFSVSYSRQRPIREQVKRQAETETSPFTQLFMWAWSGSSYSGLLCMALSSTIYCTMEVISDIFSGWLAKTAQANDSHIQDSHHIYAVLVGLLSSITAGISYCLIRAGAKSSQQPVVTIFSFGLLASPALMICMFTLENVVLPGLYSLVLMVFIGILAFFAELFLTRGLQLEKTSKVVNILYTEAALSQLWGLGSSRIAPSFGRLIGCFLILISACSTVYIGPEKDGE